MAIDEAVIVHAFHFFTVTGQRIVNVNTHSVCSIFCVQFTPDPGAAPGIICY